MPEDAFVGEGRWSTLVLLSLNIASRRLRQFQVSEALSQHPVSCQLLIGCSGLIQAQQGLVLCSWNCIPVCAGDVCDLSHAGSTFWSPNAAEIFTARALEGPYASWGNPCHGEPTDQHSITFGSQASFAIPLQAPGAPGHFLVMADRWQPNNLSDST